jgi:hypothetical protein
MGCAYMVESALLPGVRCDRMELSLSVAMLLTSNHFQADFEMGRCNERCNKEKYEYEA